MSKKIIPVSDIKDIIFDKCDDELKESISELFKQGILPAFTGILGEFPLLKIGRAVYKGGSNFRDYLFAMKFRSFVEQYQHGLSIEEMAEFRERILSSEKIFKRTIILIFEQLDKADSEFKAQLIGELFKNYIIREKKNWEDFERLCETIVNAHLDCFTYLYYFYKIYGRSTNGIIGGRFPNNESTLIISSGLGIKSNANLQIFKDAINICIYGLKTFFDSQYEQIEYDLLRKAFDDKNESNLSKFTDFEKELFLELKTSGRDPEKEWILNKNTTQKINQIY